MHCYWNSICLTLWEMSHSSITAQERETVVPCKRGQVIHTATGPGLENGGKKWKKSGLLVGTQIYSSVPPWANSPSEAETGKDGDKVRSGREERACANRMRRRKTRERKERERVVFIGLRPSRMRADTGKEPDTRRDTRTLVHCGILPYCQAASHSLPREPHRNLHPNAAQAFYLKSIGSHNTSRYL